jgi:hypothetical protein
MAGKNERPSQKIKPAKVHAIRTSRRTAKFHEEPDHIGDKKIVRPAQPGSRKRKRAA